MKVPHVTERPAKCHHCGGRQIYEEDDYTIEYICVTCGCVHLTIEPLSREDLMKRPVCQGYQL